MKGTDETVWLPSKPVLLAGVATESRCGLPSGGPEEGVPRGTEGTEGYRRVLTEGDRGVPRGIDRGVPRATEGVMLPRYEGTVTRYRGTQITQSPTMVDTGLGNGTGSTRGSQGME